jgi:hypothetical protein
MVAKSRAFDLRNLARQRVLGMEAVMQLRAKEYFDERATQEMKENLKPKERTVQEKLAYACRILAMTGQEAGQITARS